MKVIREQLREDEAHLDALKDGETFTPTLKKSTKDGSCSRKRKNRSGGKKGSCKRKRSVSDSGGEEDDIVDESESSDSDSASGSDDSDDSDDDQDSYSRSNQDEDEDIVEITAEILEERIKQSKASIKTTREILNEARVKTKEATDALSSLEKSYAKTQKEKNAFCSLKRSEVCSTNLFSHTTKLTFLNSSLVTF